MLAGKIFHAVASAALVTRVAWPGYGLSRIWSFWKMVAVVKDARAQSPTTKFRMISTASRVGDTPWGDWKRMEEREMQYWFRTASGAEQLGSHWQPKHTYALSNGRRGAIMCCLPPRPIEYSARRAHARSRGERGHSGHCDERGTSPWASST